MDDHKAKIQMVTDTYKSRELILIALCKNQAALMALTKRASGDPVVGDQESQVYKDREQTIELLITAERHYQAAQAACMPEERKTT